MLNREVQNQTEYERQQEVDRLYQAELERNFMPGPLQTAVSAFLAMLVFVCIVLLGLFSLGAL